VHLRQGELLVLVVVLYQLILHREKGEGGGRGGLQ